ncbi:NUDIX domain-containing protein [Candidatus Odyssella thessalonicensis]|uniref:NUDIX domain-containing protein n=1 Tax=Candidatus Odyssella thessalonicensis TaxID=84647 RepID=UPI000225AF18|nr:NUDIX domain-containing protein [Candidatus Odyssella thessalonicensis]
MGLRKVWGSLIFLASLATSMCTAMQVTSLSCNGDYKLPGQKPQGVAHHDIKRVGVLLVKDYGQDDKQTNDRYSIILGHDKNLSVYLPQAGKVEAQDKYSSETAARELEEETGGLIKYTAGQVSKLPYLYAGSKQLFILLDPTNTNISVNAISKACKGTQTRNLPQAFKEIDSTNAVSLIDFMKLAEQIDNGTVPVGKKYTLKTRSGRHNIQVEGFYMQVFGHPRDRGRYQRARLMFNSLLGVNLF